MLALPTQKAVAEYYDVNPALLSQWVASYRWLVAAGLREEDRRARMKAARELYHLKDRSGSSAGLRAFVTQQCEQIARADAGERAALWDVLVAIAKQRVRQGVLEIPERRTTISMVIDARATGSPAWDEYDQWNAAFARVVYDGERAQQPVYLDVEDELLEEVARHAGLAGTASEAPEHLYSAVRRTLVLNAFDGSGSVFSNHGRRLDAWRKATLRYGVSLDSPPPVLALLAVFARAAELMERDEIFRANAYYPRLAQLLSITSTDAGRMANSFRRESERFWRALNDWLAGLEGAVGLPTAEAIGHRYVGIPLSQALIRSADRQRLVQLFVEADLEPGLHLSADDMTVHLDRWIRGGGASASIQKLWKTGAGRAIVADAAVLALDQWDGTVQIAHQDGRAMQPPVLTARITKQLNLKRLRLGFALRGHVGGHDGLPREWAVSSATDAPVVRVEPISDRLLAPEFLVDVDAASLLTGELRVRPADSGVLVDAAPRRPQPLVVLSYVEEAGLFAEVERVRMLEPHLLLVNTNARRFHGNHAIDFDRLLADIAEDGYSKDTSIKGLPEGWALYRGVVVVRAHTHPDALLEPLKPAQTSTLIVSGGLRLPGHAVRWHAGAPLSLKGSAVGATSLELSLTSADSEQPLRTWSGEVDEISTSTAQLELEPGAYRAILRSQLGGKEHCSVTSFEFCDSDEPRVRPTNDPIAYNLAEPLGALTACAAPGAEGPHLGGGDTPRSSAGVELEPAWWSLTPIAYAPQTLTAPAAPDSCALTGSHHWHIEIHLQGMKKDRGVCIKCGRVQLYSPTGTKKKQAASTQYVQAPLRHLDFGEPATEISAETLIDALTWLGGGSPAELARVVRQVYDSALTVDEIVRVLEALGHISVARDPDSFAIDRWEMSPRYLAGLVDGSWIAVGAWTRGDVAALRDVAADHGGAYELDEQDWIPRRVIRGVDKAGAEGVAADLASLVVPDAGHRLLSALPPLTSATQDLSPASAEGIFDAEWFDPTQARWVNVQSIGQPGAYRTRDGLVSKYFARTSEDVAAGTLRRADSRVVKHLASASRPLVGYDHDSSRLFVPLGADLPALYGRALCLLSGRPPARVSSQALLAYSDVDEDAARAVVSLLKG
ncbi:hypothetical protein [Cellulosimicrobium funkei]|uniref:hypothetical protein n=1 Tax=Cellulosimicrobium funkei TaxID=264251 RepID=UPI0037DD0BDA